MLWHSWLRHCVTSQKVTGSIADGITGIFHWHNPSSRTMALGWTQSLKETSTRKIFWGVKAGDSYGWQHYYLQVSLVSKSGNLNLLEPSKPVIGLYRDWFTETMTIKIYAHKITFFIQTQHFSTTKIIIISNTM